MWMYSVGKETAHVFVASFSEVISTCDLTQAERRGINGEVQLTLYVF